MRSFLGWVTLVAVLLPVAFLLAPIVARPLVADAVRSLSPFGGAPLEVDADVDTLGLLEGRIDSIHVAGADLTAGRVSIGKLDVTATGVGIGDHSFSSITGSLEAVSIGRQDRVELQASRVQLSGPSDAVDATATIDRDVALGIVRGAIQDAGLPAGDIALIDGGVRLTVLGQRTDVALGVVDGAVAIAGSIAGGGSIVVFGPDPGDPWRITGVSASPSGLEVHAVLDLGSFL
jgi:hypothetical protein